MTISPVTNVSPLVTFEDSITTFSAPSLSERRTGVRKIKKMGTTESILLHKGQRKANVLGLGLVLPRERLTLQNCHQSNTEVWLSVLTRKKEKKEKKETFKGAKVKGSSLHGNSFFLGIIVIVAVIDGEQMLGNWACRTNFSLAVRVTVNGALSPQVGGDVLLRNELDQLREAVCPEDDNFLLRPRVKEVLDQIPNSRKNGGGVNNKAPLEPLRVIILSLSSNIPETLNGRGVEVLQSEPTKVHDHSHALHQPSLARCLIPVKFLEDLVVVDLPLT